MKRIFRELEIDLQSNVHVPALDGIRGLAIIIILIYHHYGLYAGWIGVDLFFVLSGFLITGILLEAKGKANYFKNFFARRILRIFPLYYSALIIFFVVIPLLVDSSKLEDYAIYYSHSPFYWAYLQNWIIYFHIMDYENINMALMHLWSLAIEEQFYLVWPFIIYLFSTKHLIRLLLFFVVLSISIRCYYAIGEFHWGHSYLNTFARLDSLSIGSLITIMLKNKLYLNVFEKITPYIFSSLFVLLFFYFFKYKTYIPDDFWFVTIGYTLSAIFFGSLLLYSLSKHKNNKIRTFLEWKWVRFFGKYSYSIYVYHFIIIWMLRASIADILRRYIDNEIASILIASTFCLILTIIVSQITWKIIERPALTLKKYF